MRFLIYLTVGSLTGAGCILDAREPTDMEQFYLELINRTRANPDAEVSRLSGFAWGDEGSPATPDLNEGLTAGTISNSAKQPLAFDPNLIDAASDYSDFLLANEKFGHFENGNAESRIRASGYPLVPSWGIGENLAITASSGSHPINESRVEQHHRNLFIDFDYPGRGHRINILSSSMREIGVAIRADLDGQSYFSHPTIRYNDVLSTQKLARSSGRLFLTGVIYYDNNSNSFYNPGESAGILALEVRNGSDTRVASGTSFSSGGYSINMASQLSGSYTLVAIDGNGTEVSRSFSWNGGSNVKVDIVDPSFTAPPVVTPPAVPSPFQPDGSIGPRENSQIGDGFLSENGAGQEVRKTAKTRKWTTWYASVRNAGTVSGSARVTGTGNNRLFKTSYRQRSGGSWANVTSAVTAGYVVPLDPGTVASYQIRVKPQARALGKRKGFQFQFTLQSINDPSVVDQLIGKLRNRTTRSRR